MAFLDRALPFLEEAQNRACGIQPFQSVIPAKQQSGEMATVGVAQALRLIVIFGEEERGIGAVGRVLIKQVVDAPQQTLWLIQSDRTLAAQIRLEIRHQQSTGDS